MADNSDRDGEYWFRLTITDGHGVVVIEDYPTRDEAEEAFDLYSEAGDTYFIRRYHDNH